MQYHVMKGRIEAPTEAETNYTMLNGQNITVRVDGEKTFVHGVHNEPVEMLERNIHCANGYIHVISSFLVPEYPEYEPGPYNNSIYNTTNGVFEPQELDFSKLPVPDGWYDEDDPEFWEAKAAKEAKEAQEALEAAAGSTRNSESGVDGANEDNGSGTDNNANKDGNGGSADGWGSSTGGTSTYVSSFGEVEA